MSTFKGKKLLMLDGATHSLLFLQRAKELGIKTVIANFYDEDKSQAKRYADESVKINFSDLSAMKELMINMHVDGVLQGCTDSHLVRVADLCNTMDFPCYATRAQFEMLSDKERMKQICTNYDIPVTKDYVIDDIDGDLSFIDYPVITKPVDGSGSRGFSICKKEIELKKAYKKASSYSESGRVLVESFMDYKNSVIINYTLVDGDITFCGISDKSSKKVTESGAPIMAFQYYPSLYEKEYLEMLNEKMITMLKGIGLKNGVIWIEAFYKDGVFTVNEFGYRFGGSMTYYPVEYFYGIKQLDLMIEYALTGKNESYERPIRQKKNNVYCIFPVHVHPGVISDIEGMEKIEKKEGFIKFVPGHLKGDVIEDWGSTQQVFGYFHFVVSNREEAKSYAKDIMDNVRVCDEQGNQLLYNLFINED